MKWACIILVIIDLILVGGAAFRFLTVPKSEVNTYVTIYEGNAEKLNSENSGFDSSFSSSDFSGQSSDASFSSTDDEEPYDIPPGPTIVEQIENKKAIEVNDETIFTYDDQATKQEGLDASKKKMKAVFRTSQ
ncbi:MAG: hypothetical protein ACFCU1_12180 [Sumerlaeia bacterium]